jgi:septal ring factor EnvC (AmiA/AmiB activator)
VEKLRAQVQHLQQQLLAAEEHAGKAAEAAAAAHGAVVEGLQGMLAQSEVTQPVTQFTST